MLLLNESLRSLYQERPQIFLTCYGKKTPGVDKETFIGKGLEVFLFRTDGGLQLNE